MVDAVQTRIGHFKGAGDHDSQLAYDVCMHRFVQAWHFKRFWSASIFGATHLTWKVVKLVVIREASTCDLEMCSDMICQSHSCCLMCVSAAVLACQSLKRQYVSCHASQAMCCVVGPTCWACSSLRLYMWPSRPPPLRGVPAWPPSPCTTSKSNISSCARMLKGSRCTTLAESCMTHEKVLCFRQITILAVCSSSPRPTQG